MIDIAGHLGYLLIAGGMYLLSKKNIAGWPCRFFGELIWVAIGLELAMTSIWVWGFIFMLIDLKGFHDWFKKAEEEAEDKEIKQILRRAVPIEYDKIKEK